VLTIGSSTGGPQALQTIFEALPRQFPVPILCVQHISDGFLQGLIDWLNLKSALQIKIAIAGETPQPGVVYFPPERQHLQLNSQGRFEITRSAPVAGHCPSVTVLFESVAAYYRRSAVGILLTGMGRDGADGLKAIALAGGTTIAQNEATSVVFGMPKEAIALGAAQQVLPIQNIAPFLLEKVFAASQKS
jgi:two-component system chemotaxis response regulator CheB